MSKNSVFSGQPIFGQIVSLMDKAKVDTPANSHGRDRYCKRFDTFEHLITMLYGVVSGATPNYALA